MSIPYRFVPWTRRGLARAHRNADTAAGPLAVRPRITVGLTLQAKRDGNAATAVSGNIDLTLYGPSDIIGIDPRLVVRTDPKPNVRNFEPNYLTLIDFDPPDFPWMLTPATADVAKRLRPWLVLVVVERSKVAPPRLFGGRPLPSIVVKDGNVATELPHLNESWLWAHTQAVSQVPAANVAALSAELLASPERNISRLICPRRLEPRKDYVACVVPATDGGRLRGLGQPVAGATLQPAWSPDDPEVELPVYYHWEFSTGPVGDIETLARRLRTPQQYGADAALLSQLRHIGEQKVAVDGDHLLFDGTTPKTTVFEGAMVSLDFSPVAPDPVFANKLQAMLNSGHDSAVNGTAPAADVPTLSPPIYGEHPAKRHTVDGTKVAQHWLHGLSCQPRYRLAAGWGAEVVRRSQDEFMQAAWEQVGEVLAAERALSLSRLSRDVLKRIEARHLAKLPPERLLAVMAPSRARIRVSPTQSLYGQIDAATLPSELFDGAMRRFTSPRRATFRLAQWHTRRVALATTMTQMTALVQTFANASANLTAIDPNRFAPDGLLGSRSYDAIPLPADLASLVDLAPFTGLDVNMTGAEIKAIQDKNAAARRLAATTPRTPPVMDDIRTQGLLTETHALRVEQLERAAGRPLPNNIGQLIEQSSQPGAAGILLTVQPGGQVISQPVSIDPRTGVLNASHAALTLEVSGAVVRPSGVTQATTLGSVPLQALQQHGSALFARLPPSTLGQMQRQVAISSATRPGGLGARPPEIRAAATITVPPSVKDEATLTRYTTAFTDYQHVVAPAADTVPTVAAVNFATAAAVTRARARIDPRETVPARLASMLSLGAGTVQWSGGTLTNTFISTRLDLAPPDLLRFLIPRAFDRVMHFPHLRFPLSRKLERLAPEVFLPGVGVLPNDFIMAVKTNPRFVEALMLGANHEMARELLWQGYPTDSRGTPFQKFWQRFDDADDITPIHQWLGVPLGAQPASTEMLVLLIRGQLLERFPNLSVYAYPIAGAEKRPGGANPPVPNDASEMDAGKIVLPVMHGHLNRDITYIGFPIKPADITKFFFIIEEHMTEPRFGFDEPDPADNQTGNTWLEIDWSEVGVGGGTYFGSQALKSASPATGPRWTNPHAATVADALLQRPFRGYWRGQALKMP